MPDDASKETTEFKPEVPIPISENPPVLKLASGFGPLIGITSHALPAGEKWTLFWTWVDLVDGQIQGFDVMAAPPGSGRIGLPRRLTVKTPDGNLKPPKGILTREQFEDFKSKAPEGTKFTL